MKKRFLSTISGRAVILGALVLFGAGVRFWDLAWHFAHSDDIGVARTILAAKRAGAFDLFAVPAYWTYAPFQFLWTTFLIHPDQSYREILFWGRLPSCVFSVAGLISLICFYRQFDGPRSRKVFFALTLLACSWEAIIHAKQMHNYGIGVWASILLFQLLLYPVSRKDFSLRTLILIALGLAGVSAMQYQALFFIPAFFFALFTAGFVSAPTRLPFLRNFAASVLVYSASVAPMVYFFLRKRVSGVYDWCSGPHGEFLLSFKEGASLTEKAGHALIFFVKNLFIIFQANTAFLPESHPLARAFGILLFALFLFGGMSFFRRRDPAAQALGLFFAGSAAVWALLVGFQKLTFGPTRHALILLPFMIVLAAEGAGWVWGHFAARILGPQSSKWAGRAVGLASGGILIIFLLNFHVFLRERRDVFDEADLLSVMKRHQTNTLITTRDTYNLSLMKSMQAHFDPQAASAVDPYRTVAWVSHREKFLPERFIAAMIDMHAELLQLRDPAPGWREVAQKFLGQRNEGEMYRTVYSRELDSPVEVDYSTRTKNGGNGLYLYILRKEMPV